MVEHIELHCPGCRKRLTVDVAFAGGVCRCSHCGTMMKVPASRAPSRPARPTARPEAPPVAGDTSAAPIARKARPDAPQPSPRRVPGASVPRPTRGTAGAARPTVAQADGAASSPTPTDLTDVLDGSPREVLFEESPDFSDIPSSGMTDRVDAPARGTPVLIRRRRRRRAGLVVAILVLVSIAAAVAVWHFQSQEPVVGAGQPMRAPQPNAVAPE